MEDVEFLKGYVCMMSVAVDVVEGLLKKHFKVLVRQGKDALEAKKAKAKTMKNRMR
jgi:hypothetical protein